MTSTARKAPLEDLMVAMDVVDTLRHRQQLVDRELDADARRERLIAKLRDIYQAQGLEVTDQLLADGVRALEEDRFKYIPPDESFSTRLANVYVRRAQWLKPAVLAMMFIIGLGIFYFFGSVRPASIARDALPEQLTQRYAEIIQIASNDDVYAQALLIQNNGRLALDNSNFSEAGLALAEMDAMLDSLKLEYQLRVIQRPGESSGFWRIPDANDQAQNFYLAIEAIDSAGNILSLPILNEETGEITIVDKWGIRVVAEVFETVAADKSDDGIIQGRGVGQKLRGLLQPEYSIPTTGATITNW